MTELKIMTYNCRGLGGHEKRRDVINFLRKQDFDIYLIQDTHLVEKSAPYFKSLWPGKCYHSFGTVNSRGTSILFKPNIQHSIIQEEYSLEGNYAILLCSIFTNTYTIVSLYGPNEDRPMFFEEINGIISGLSSDHLFVGGDFNFVPDYQLDSNYHQQNNPRARDAFAKVIETHNLVDAWREMNPDSDGYTWVRRNPLKYGRLDRLYVQEHLMSHITTASIRAGYRSDHSMVTICIIEPQKKRGPGLWKFNESLLGDKTYTKMVGQLIFDIIKQYAVPIYSEEFISNSSHFDTIQYTISDRLFYETLIMLIRGETVRYSKRKARRSRKEESDMMCKIDRLKHAFDQNKSQSDLALLEEAQHELENFRKPKIQGLITRSRVNWYEEGEKSSKYFLSLEKRNTARNSVQCLRFDDCIVTKKDVILQCFSDNLQAKYCKDKSTINPIDYLENNVKSKLSDAQKDLMDAPLSMRELHEALMGMKKGKSPGTNGFTSGFFKYFWDLLGPILFRAFKDGLESGTTLNSHRESVVTLIPKQGKPKDSLKGWRPISLLNVDFKIISAAFANRLKAVMRSLISPLQTAYIPGRFIGENSRLTYDVIEHVNAASSSGIIMAIDFEAAFDTVSWEFLLKALANYNFGPRCIEMIKTLYLNPKNFCRILLDGNLGPKIHMGRGIRQGDPVSGYLFNLVMEPLTNQILFSKNIQGIPIGIRSEARLSQYADDLIIFSRACTTSLECVFHELERFTEVSGLHVNKEKTKCLHIGNPADTDFLADTGLNVVNEMKLLGIWFNSSNKDIVTRNISEVLPKLSQDIIQWKRRNLTLIGKITIVKALLLSKLVHIFSALPNPSKRDLEKISGMLFKYIWNEGPDKIKRIKLAQDYDRDGLKMIDLASFVKSSKISWLKRLYWAESESTWANIIKEQIPPVEDFVCFGTFKLRDIAKSKLKNRFWCDVLNAWADLIATLRITPALLLTEKLWFSDNTKFKKSIVKDWNDKGLRFVADLFCKETGTPYSTNDLNALFNVKMTFLCHASLIKSISSFADLGDAVRKATFPILPYNISLMTRQAKISRIAYNHFITSLHEKQGTGHIERKWRRDIGCMHQGTTRDIRLSTRNTYLHAFHYRIINRIVSTNTFLYRIGKERSPLCTFCKGNEETLYHILWDCSIVQEFICEVAACLKNKFNFTINFDSESWFFPRLVEEGRIQILIKTIAKLTIFKSKYKEKQPNISFFISTLKLEAQKEEACAVRHKTKEKFLRKWEGLSKLLET